MLELTNLLLLLLLLLIVAYFLVRRLFLEHIYIVQRGKYVLVSGCDSGFGRRLVVKLLEQGVNVFAGCYTDEGIQSLQAEWKSKFGCSFHGHVFPFPLDVTADESVVKAKKYVSEVLEQKNATLWGLVNNAGIFTTFGPDDWCGSGEYMRSLNVNTLGVVRMCHAFVPLIKRAKGRIVTMGSTAGRLHGLYVAPYVTAKFAVGAYTDCLRLELADFGVTVHLLEPGAFKTELLDDNAQRTRVDRIWNSLTQETKEEYGEEFRKNFEVAWQAGVNTVANPNLQWVIDCYYHALFAWWPRLRYSPGWDAIFMFIPLSVFPTFIQDVVLRNLYALSPGPRLTPAVLKMKNSKSTTQSIVKAVTMIAQLALIPLICVFREGFAKLAPVGNQPVAGAHQTQNHSTIAG